jgi:DNA polymerase V
MAANGRKSIPQEDLVIGLCDCNSFYASCERLFRPDLKRKPVVVLSNNDGCIVSATAEVKSLGIARGASYGSVKETLERNGVAVFSSNYPFYQDISDRVMALLSESVEGVAPYSIDEAFFTFGALSQTEGQWRSYEQEIRRIHRRIERLSGVPVSIGMARSKTLAKLANHIGKDPVRYGGCYVLRPELEEDLLRRIRLEDVWGIGPRRAAQMYRYGLRTAWDLTVRDDRWIERHFTVTGLQTAWELRGREEIDVETSRMRTLCSGITFAEPLTEFETVARTLSCHCMALSEKLRKRGVQATDLAVHLFTNRFKANRYSAVQPQPLAFPTAYPPALYQAAKQALHIIWREGHEYAGSRIWVTGLVPAGQRQFGLFDSEHVQAELDRQDRMTQALAQIEHDHGRRALLCGSGDMKLKLDLSRQLHLSPRYTTRWSDIPVVR